MKPSAPALNNLTAPIVRVLKQQCQFRFTMRYTLILWHMLTIVIPDCLSLLIAQRDMLGHQEQASRRHIQMDEILIHDVGNPSILDMPATWIRQIERLARHPNLSEIMEESY